MNLEDKKFIFLVSTHRAYKEYKKIVNYIAKGQAEKLYQTLKNVKFSSNLVQGLIGKKPKKYFFFLRRFKIKEKLQLRQASIQ